MGVWADIFLGEKCKFCGARSLEDLFEIQDDEKEKPFVMKWCHKCQYVGVYGTPPKCHCCGTRMTYVTQNHNDVYVPQCPHCGWIYD